ncbi:SDR family oxidoreductase [Microbulbifer hydrolyticus]|uniref:3-oxoacyl-[acyl-carrier protein] reductase n=1 Tax=Microbulbifer hydrolyticus TaxID=48074 RepID=A0A6P1TB27_9GAMM|nr:SDR family oxidoreductase [Microbulbifer hydrolyticus]MBB5210549.1 3-oxoacyl-[acyl-carrier protein] reductase [Microbulbifer hydrolyticus]QHQ38981.1 SDR family oxidoreductase [Microbulbifer hydrolyticus]
MEIKDAVVAITGAGRGLGRAMATHLAARGARLALIDIDAQALAETAELCGESRVYATDITDEVAVDATFARIRGEFSRVDVLVNNAGLLRDGLLLKVEHGEVVGRMSLQQWQSVIDVNLTGVFLCGRAAASHMLQGRGGVIVNLSSVARAGNAGQSNYAASKAGVAAMTTTWAKELARYNIRVAAIAPGFVETEMVAQMRPEVLERMLAKVPLKRIGQPDEIASALRFIIENDYVSGRTIEVDGGLRM